MPRVELDFGDAGAGEAVDCVADRGLASGVLVVGVADVARLLAHLQALRRAEVRGDVAGGERAAVVRDRGHVPERVVAVGPLTADLGFGRIAASETEALAPSL